VENNGRKTEGEENMFNNGNGAVAGNNGAAKDDLFEASILEPRRGVKQRNKARRIRRALAPRGLLLLSAAVGSERRYFIVSSRFNKVDIDEAALALGVADPDEYVRRHRHKDLLRRIETGNDTDALDALVELRRAAKG